MYDYHDATLKNAIIDWESGTTIISFELCREPAQSARITVKRMSEFVANREFPWGKSYSVNGVVMQAEQAGQRLEIEMQSGDRITIRGEEVLEDLI